MGRDVALRAEDDAESAAGVLAGHVHSLRNEGLYATLVSIIPFIIFCAASYWVYTTHQKMKELGAEPSRGWKSIGCFLLCCCGCGTFLGLCFPLDGDVPEQSKAEDDS